MSSPSEQSEQHNAIVTCDFDKCVNLRRGENGDYIFECKKGLWGANSYSYTKARREADHYFAQYKADGEYHQFIGGDDPATVLLKSI